MENNDECIFVSFTLTTFQFECFFFSHLHRPLEEWFMNVKWTPESTTQWQEFYNKAPRVILFNRQSQFELKNISSNPLYEDLKVEPCKKKNR